MGLLKTKKHKALERLWYEKLKSEGFKDCENTELRHRPLKEWHSFAFPLKDQAQREAAIEYYENAAEILHLHDFEKLIHKKIWEMHCQGLSRRQIEQELEKSRIKKKVRQVQIQTIIKKIAKGLL